jgi:hypothetical protein
MHPCARGACVSNISRAPKHVRTKGTGSQCRERRHFGRIARAGSCGATCITTLQSDAPEVGRVRDEEVKRCPVNSSNENYIRDAVREATQLRVDARLSATSAARATTRAIRRRPLRETTLALCAPLIPTTPGCGTTLDGPSADVPLREATGRYSNIQRRVRPPLRIPPR